jgi:hypothetical protein
MRLKLLSDKLNSNKKGFETKKATSTCISELVKMFEDLEEKKIDFIRLRWLMKRCSDVFKMLTSRI